MEARRLLWRAATGLAHLASFFTVRLSDLGVASQAIGESKNHLQEQDHYPKAKEWLRLKEDTGPPERLSPQKLGLGSQIEEPRAFLSPTTTGAVNC